MLIGTSVRFSWIFILVFLLSFLSCGGENRADWTVLFYFDGDNGLAEHAFQDLQELEKVGSDHRVRLIAELDFPESADLIYSRTKRMEIARDDDPSRLGSPVIEDLGEMDMADPQTLVDFIRWGTEKYPARRYALFLWDHGDAWYQESVTSQQLEGQRLALSAVEGSKLLPAPRLRQAGKAQSSQLTTRNSKLETYEPEAIFIDEDNGSGPMKNFQLREALAAAGVHFDLLAFDSCIMATIEVAYELKNQSDLMVASQEFMQENGLPYDVIFSRLRENPEMPPEELAVNMVDDYRDYSENVYYPQGLLPNQTLSALRLGPDLEALASAVDQAALYLLGQLPSGAADHLAQARDEAEELDPFRPHFYVDLYDLFCRLNLPSDLFNGFAEGFSRTVIREYHGPVHPRARGLSIVFPETPDAAGNYDPTYSDYDPAAGTGSPSLFMELSWDNLLSEYYRLKYPGIAF